MTALMIPAVCISLLCFRGLEAKVPNVNDEIFQHLDSEEYDQNVRPNFGQGPVIVSVSLHISSIRSVSSNDMEYTATILFRERWRDERLGFNKEKWNETSVVLNKDVAKAMWRPDAYFPNVISSNEDDRDVKSLLRLEHDGHVLLGRRISVKGECPMDLSMYPFDEQACSFSIESYGYPTKDLIYEWVPGEPVQRDVVKLPNLNLAKIKTTSVNVSFATGDYTRLICCFLFTRSRGYYFVQLFVPAASVVITTWFALWLRVTENSFSDMINLMLTVTLLYFSYNTLMPAVSYVKAMDLYLIACFALVVIALIKTAIVQGITFHQFGSSKVPACMGQGEETEPFQNENGENLMKDHKESGQDKKQKGGVRRVMSQLCGLLLPLIFLLFCLAYFSFYTLWPARGIPDVCDF